MRHKKRATPAERLEVTVDLGVFLPSDHNLVRRTSIHFGAQDDEDRENSKSRYSH